MRMELRLGKSSRPRLQVADNGHAGAESIQVQSDTSHFIFCLRPSLPASRPGPRRCHAPSARLRSLLMWQRWQKAKTVRYKLVREAKAKSSEPVLAWHGEMEVVCWRGMADTKNANRWPSKHPAAACLTKADPIARPAVELKPKVS